MRNTSGNLGRQVRVRYPMALQAPCAEWQLMMLKLLVLEAATCIPLAAAQQSVCTLQCALPKGAPRLLPHQLLKVSPVLDQ